MTTTSPASLPLTGERTVPGVPQENYWFQRHVVAYRFAAALAVGRRVLDSGCGEGYGLPLLARSAASVTGVELADWVVAHARRAYPGHDVLQADVCDLPLPAECIDLVVSLQVIEHLPDVPRFLAEQRRVLAAGGAMVIATPNRLTFSPHDHEGSDPQNLFHVQEFTAAELVGRLRSVGLAAVRVMGVHHGARIRAIESATGRAFVSQVLQPVTAWPRWLHAVVARITPDDFVVREHDVDESLDLLIVARPETPGR